MLSCHLRGLRTRCRGGGNLEAAFEEGVFGQALTLEQLSQLLWVAQGVTEPTIWVGLRSAPSVGGLYRWSYMRWFGRVISRDLRPCHPSNVSIITWMPGL
jgi:hypothetical protein